MSLRIGVVLSGCGVFDGAEIREAVLCLLALDQEGAAFQCIAPDKPQMHVVDHLAGAPEEGATRNALVEAARIARGKIVATRDVRGGEFDALVFPGGFGVAKNLCDFATKGAACAVDPEVARLIREARAAEKPLCFCCIAPALAAKALADAGVRGVALTVGAPGDAATAIGAMGQRHVVARADQCVIDDAHRVVSTPAYMYDDARLGDIYTGIRKAIHATVEMASRVATASGGEGTRQPAAPPVPSARRAAR